MILILSQTVDAVANTVCEWLHYYQKSFLRINTDSIDDLNLTYAFSEKEKLTQFDYNGINYNLSDFNCIWFRRGRYKYSYIDKQYHNHPIVNRLIVAHLENEIKFFNDFICEKIDEKVKAINNPLLYNFNKLKAFKIAQEVGFRTPKTLITNKKEVAINYFNPSERLITKCIQDVFSVRDFKNGIFLAYQLKSIDWDYLNNLPDIFFYSCFQLYIEKKYEIRVFVFFELIYAVAIMSQKYEESKQDGRVLHTDDNRIIRIIPYSFDTIVKQKILMFMRKAELNSGSIDFIITPDDNLFFLEVNPVGQFEYVSKRGNFNIEQHIASVL